MERAQLEQAMREIGISQIIERNGNLMACCPFHSESNPSWGISLEPPHFHGCFACHAKGTLLDLLVKVGKIPLHRAKKLCEVGEYSRLSDFSVIRPHLEEAMPEVEEDELFPYTLTERAKKYLKTRGISRRTMSATGLLYAPKENRILFPWYWGEQLVSVTGRSLDRYCEAKTIPMFGSKKVHCLYLPNRKILATTPLILVEGEIDALKVYDAGFKNVGALGYGNFSKKVKNLVLNSGVNEVTIFTDSDPAGQGLMREICLHLTGYVKLNSVDYIPLARHYIGEYKLDPAVLSKEHIHQSLTKYLFKNVDWPQIKLA